MKPTMHPMTRGIVAVLPLAAPLALVIATLGACSLPWTSWRPLAAPVEYPAVELVVADRGSLHERAGLYVTVTNVDSREIVSLELAWDLFNEADVPYPEPGRNSFWTRVSGSIVPGATVSYCVSLDPVVGPGDPAPALARFRARTVTFADGSRWRNSGAHVAEASR